MFNCVRFNYFSGSKFVFLNGGQEGGSAEKSEKNLHEAVESIISEDLKKIDEIGDKPEELEKVVETALNKLGDLYKDKIRDKQTAQKHALELLASRACDLDGDGKINTKEEKTVKIRVDSALGDIYRKIDGAASSAESSIEQATKTASEFKSEAIGNKGFLTNDLADASDPGVKKAYAEFTKAENYFTKMCMEYGLIVDTPSLSKNMPITEDNILDSLDHLADLGNKVYKRARAKGELPAMAASIATELSTFKEDVSHSRGALVNAIDAWHDSVVKNAHGNKEVDVKALAQAISDAKVSVLAQSEKASAQGAAWKQAKEANRKEAGNTTGMEERSYAVDFRYRKAEDKLEAAQQFLNGEKLKYGLNLYVPLTEDNILDALDGLADRGNKIYKRARAKGELPVMAGQILSDLKAYERDIVKARGELEQVKAEAGRFGLEEGSALARQEKVKEEGWKRIAEAAKADYKGSAKEKLVARAEEIKAQRAWEKTEKDVAGAMTKKSLEDIRKKAETAKKTAKDIFGGAAKVAKRLGGEAVAAASEAKKDEGIIHYEVSQGENMIKILKQFYPVDQVNMSLAREIQKQSLGGVATLKSGVESLIKPGDTIKLPKTVTYIKNGEKITVERNS